MRLMLNGKEIYVRLVQLGPSAVRLVICDERGNSLTAGVIATLTEEGLHRHRYLDGRGLETDSFKRIKDN